MTAPWLMVAASFLFALLGVCVKLASARYGTGEIVLYRSVLGLALMAGVLRWRGISWRTRVPAMHFWRSVSGATALCLWFFAIAGLPLATAMTLNYMSSVWIALFLVGGAVLHRRGRARAARVDARLVAAVLAGFAGVALVLRPTITQDQLGHGLVGLASGLVAAVAYLQVAQLGRMGEPGERVVLYFCLGGAVFGAAIAGLTDGLHAHTAAGLGQLAAIGLLATLAQWLMTRAYGSGATLGIASLQYLGIAFSFLLGLLVFDENLTALSLVGILLIVAAGVAATLLHPRTDAVAATDSKK